MKKAIYSNSKKRREIKLFLRKIVMIFLILGVVQTTLYQSYSFIAISLTILGIDFNIMSKNPRPKIFVELAKEASNIENIFISVIFAIAIMIPIWASTIIFFFIGISFIIGIIAGAYFEGVRLRYLK